MEPLKELLCNDKLIDFPKNIRRGKKDGSGKHSSLVTTTAVKTFKVQAHGKAKQ